MSLHSSGCPSEISQPIFPERHHNSTPPSRNDTSQIQSEGSEYHSWDPVPRHTGTMSPTSPSSDILRTSQAYAPLGIKFLNDKQMIQELRSDQTKSPVVSDSLHLVLSMHGKKLQPLHHADVPDVESPIDVEMSENMQQLSVS